MKKAILSMLILTIILVSGCSISERYDSVTQAKNAVDAGYTIIEALENHDDELLKSVLSDKALASEDLDEGIEYCFEIFDGKVSSTKIYGTENSFPEYDRYDGEQRKRSKAYSGAFDITTDSGKVYYLDFYYYAIQDFDETEIGVNNIKLSIKDEITDKYTASEEYDRVGIYNPSWSDDD